MKLSLITLCLVLISCAANQSPENHEVDTKPLSQRNLSANKLIGKWRMCFRKYGNTNVHADVCSDLVFTDSKEAIARVPSKSDQPYTWSVSGDSLSLKALNNLDSNLMFPSATYYTQFTENIDGTSLILFLGEDTQLFLGKM